MYQTILSTSGLTQTQAEVFDYLLGFGEEKASIIAKKIKRPRGVVYKALEELLTFGLVERLDKPNQVSRFRAEHPRKLEKIFEEKEKSLKKEKSSFFQNLPDLISAYNLSSYKPGISFYEGVEGINKIYDEYVLNSPEVISCGSYDSALTASDWKAESEYINKIQKKNLSYRAILENTETNHKLDEIAKGVMQNKFLPLGKKVSADILVFGSFVALISYENKTATLIEDKSIAEAIKMYLEFMWESL